MGLFNSKPKTSADYLNEISKTMKTSQRVQDEAAKAQKVSAEAQAESARAAARVSDAKAREIEERIRQQKLAEEKADLQQRKDAFEKFLQRFSYDFDDAESIMQASLSMINWLDNVDRSFKNETAEYEELEDTFDDSDKHKEELLIKRLASAVEQLQKLGVPGNKAAHIAQRLKFYEERQYKEIAEAEARKQMQKERKTKTRIITISVIAIAIFVIWLVARPTAKNNSSICESTVREYVAKGKLDKAKKTLYKYEKSALSVRDGYELLVSAYISAGNIEGAIVVASMGDGAVDHLLQAEFIKRGEYEKAKEYTSSYYYYDYIKECVSQMCSNGQCEEAKKFAKRESSFFVNDKSRTPNDVIKDMNAIIASYE
ncbi:MAG: hypothetical protein E7145_00275 [Rikenellaceae bacterium]|nr:hypothetical protein [Rikenellaceae bacterium]